MRPSVWKMLNCTIFIFLYAKVSIPIGEHDGCPCAVSLLAKNGADGMLLDTTPLFFPALQKEVKAYPDRKEEVVKEAPRPDDAESAKEKVKSLVCGAYLRLFHCCLRCCISYIRRLLSAKYHYTGKSSI